MRLLDAGSAFYGAIVSGRGAAVKEPRWRDPRRKERERSSVRSSWLGRVGPHTT